MHKGVIAAHNRIIVLIKKCVEAQIRRLVKIT